MVLAHKFLLGQQYVPYPDRGDHHERWCPFLRNYDRHRHRDDECGRAYDRTDQSADKGDALLVGRGLLDLFFDDGARDHMSPSRRHQMERRIG